MKHLSVCLFLCVGGIAEAGVINGQATDLKGNAIKDGVTVQRFSAATGRPIDARPVPIRDGNYKITVDPADFPDGDKAVIAVFEAPNRERQSVALSVFKDNDFDVVMKISKPDPGCCSPAPCCRSRRFCRW